VQAGFVEMFVGNMVCENFVHFSCASRACLLFSWAISVL